MRAIPECEICNRKKGLEAHHIVPFHIAPDLELKPNNLMALCRRCHLFVGHLGGWQRFNINVETDAMLWRAKMLAAK
jgi:5-methylcytosine-specific restriction endonuclease McrA